MSLKNSDYLTFNGSLATWLAFEILYGKSCISDFAEKCEAVPIEWYFTTIIKKASRKISTRHGK